MNIMTEEQLLTYDIIRDLCVRDEVTAREAYADLQDSFIDIDDLYEIEDVLMDDFGLEPDYVLDVVSLFFVTR